MEHEIIQDLLPLYHDGVCSDKSRAAVEAHLQECGICRKALADMDAPLPSAEQLENQAEGEGVRQLSKVWKQKKRRAWLRGILLGLVICGLVLGGLWLAGVVRYPVPAEDLTVAIYQAPEEEALYLHCELMSGRESFVGFEFRDEGAERHYFISRPILRKSVFKEQSVRRVHNFMLEFENDPEIHSYYFDWGEQPILLWKDGEMEDFPQAPEEILEIWSTFGEHHQ